MDSNLQNDRSNPRRLTSATALFAYLQKKAMCGPSTGSHPFSKAQSGECSNALYAASEGGHQTMVELLLAKGADAKRSMCNIHGRWDKAMQGHTIIGAVHVHFSNLLVLKRSTPFE